MDQFFKLLLTIAEFILAIGVLAFIHEFGHFITCRLFNVDVEEFGFGFPPRMLKLFEWKGTIFSLNWIPFGAFVRPGGENNPDIPGGLAAANPWVRLIVFAGGPILNLATAIILFNLIFTKIGAPDLTRVELQGINENSPAALAGLMPGDIILFVNDQAIDSMDKMGGIVRENHGKEIDIQLSRDGKTITTSATPRLNPPEGEGSLGIIMGNPSVPLNWIQALPYSTKITFEQGKELFTLPIKLLRNQIPADQARVVGPKGLFDIYQQTRQLDEEAAMSKEEQDPTLNSLYFLAIISVALGFTNLLPLPALDGGRILFILPEIILRKRVPAIYENLVHSIGFLILISFMVYITTQDIFNPLFPVGTPMP